MNSLKHYMIQRLLIVYLPITILTLAAVLTWANWPHSKLPQETKADRILVEKAKRTLTLFHGEQKIKSYPISLGWNPVGPKQREGDRKTPEGIYRITEHKTDSAYYRALRISYPESKDIQQARQLQVPPGSDIMIHGIRNGLGVVGRMQRWFDWTAGCIALTNPEMAEIFHATQPGAQIEIRE